jgi:integrase
MPMPITVRPRGEHWQYQIHTRGPDGRRISERRNVPDVVRTEKAARAWAEARAAHLTKHGEEVEAAEVPTVRAWSEAWLEACRGNKLKPATLDAYGTRLRLHILPALGNLPVTEVDDAAIGRLKLKMGKLDGKTVNDTLGVLSAMLNLAERRQVIDRAPRMERVAVEEKGGAEIRFHDFDEWERLVAGAALVGPEVLAFVLLAGEAGLRRGELVALEQVDVGPQEITIRWTEWQKNAKEKHTGSTKGRRVRRVPMTPRLRVAIAKVRHLRGPRLLWQANGRKVSLTTLQSWLETASRRAALTPSRDIHKLRHTFCSHLAMRGATANAIKELAGHADLSTTQRYMHLSPAHKTEAIGLLERRGDGTGVEPKAAEPAK